MRRLKLISWTALVLMSLGLTRAYPLEQTVAGPSWGLTDDQKTLIVTFPSNPPVALKLDPTEVEKFIVMLGSQRSAMIPGRSMDAPDPGTAMQVFQEGRWYIEPEATTGLTTLALLTSGYGWVGLRIQPASAQDLARHLLENLSQSQRNEILQQYGRAL